MIKLIVTLFVTLIVFDFLLKWAFNIHFLRFLGKCTPYFFKGVWYIIKSIFKFIYWVFKSIFSVLLNLGDDEVHSASFLEGSDLKQLLHKSHDGLTIDGTNRIKAKDDSFRNLIVAGNSGSGKSSCVVLPCLLNLTAFTPKSKPSVVLTDLSGELSEKSAEFIRSIDGYTVKIFNVSDIQNSLRYNPLEYVNNHNEIGKLAQILVDSAFPPSSGGNDSFWNKSSITIISLVIKCIKNNPNEIQNLQTVFKYINMFGVHQKELDKLMCEFLDENSFSTYSAQLVADPKVLANIISTCKTCLEKLEDQSICDILEYDSLDLNSLREESTVLFLIIPEHELKYYGFILNILWSQLMSYASLPPSQFNNYKSLYFILDEAGHFRVSDLEIFITVLRKRAVSITLLLQSYSQLISCYGLQNAETIIHGGCANKIFLPGLAKESNELEKMLGRKIITKTDHYNKKIDEKVPLLSADQIRTLNDGEALFIQHNKRPVLLNMTPYYKNRAFKRLLNI
jgi:type IV secretion system protein VirD4